MQISRSHQGIAGAGAVDPRRREWSGPTLDQSELRTSAHFYRGVLSQYQCHRMFAVESDRARAAGLEGRQFLCSRPGQRHRGHVRLARAALDLPDDVGAARTPCAFSPTSRSGPARTRGRLVSAAPRAGRHPSARDPGRRGSELSKPRRTRAPSERPRTQWADRAAHGNPGPRRPTPSAVLIDTGSFTKDRESLRRAAHVRPQFEDGSQARRGSPGLS